MNRHARRKAFALGQAVARGEAKVPESYVKMVFVMQKALTWWRQKYPDEKPHFRLPPKEIALAASIDHMPAICGNASARTLVAVFCACAEELEPGNAPTVLQLGYVLEHAGIEVERVGIGELGIDVSRGTYTPGKKEPFS